MSFGIASIAKSTGYVARYHCSARKQFDVAVGTFSRPMRSTQHRELHSVSRIGWLRAAVLGANDGIISTASLILGVAAASAGRSDIFLAGSASLLAGAMSMAAGEYWPAGYFVPA